MASSAADDAGLAPALEGGDLVTKFVTTSDQKSAEQVSPDEMELTPFGVITVGCTIAAAATTRESKPLWQNDFGVSCQNVTPIAASMRGGEEKVHPTGVEHQNTKTFRSKHLRKHKKWKFAHKFTHKREAKNSQHSRFLDGLCIGAATSTSTVLSAAPIVLRRLTIAIGASPQPPPQSR